MEFHTLRKTALLEKEGYIILRNYNKYYAIKILLEELKSLLNLISEICFLKKEEFNCSPNANRYLEGVILWQI